MSSLALATPPLPARADTVAARPEPVPRWDPLLVCAAAYILTTVGRVHQLFPVLEAIRPALLIGVLAIALYALDHHAMRRLHRSIVSPSRWLLAFFVWAALTIPSALVQGNSFDLVANNLAKTVAMVFVVAGAVRGIRDVERLAGAYLAGAGVYALVVLARFDLGGGANWRLGDLYYYDANDLATFLVTALPLGVYFLYAARRQTTRLLTAGTLLAITVVFVATGSRGGFIALVATGGYILVRYTAIRLKHRVGAAALVVLALVGAASDRYWEQMTTILEENDYNRTEEGGRMQIWARGIGYTLANPVFGVGAGNFETAEGTISPLADRQNFGRGVPWNAAHNSYIQAAAELGIPGLILFVGVIATSLRALARTRRQHAAAGRVHGRRELSQALTAAIIGFAVGAFFLTLAYSEMLYTLVALAIALVKTAPPPAAAAPPRSHLHAQRPYPRPVAHRASH